MTPYRILLERQTASVKAHNLGVAYLRMRQLNDAAAELKVVQKDASRTAEAGELFAARTTTARWWRTREAIDLAARVCSRLTTLETD